MTSSHPLLPLSSPEEPGCCLGQGTQPREEGTLCLCVLGTSICCVLEERGPNQSSRGAGREVQSQAPNLAHPRFRISPLCSSKEE